MRHQLISQWTGKWSYLIASLIVFFFSFSFLFFCGCNLIVYTMFLAFVHYHPHRWETVRDIFHYFIINVINEKTLCIFISVQMSINSNSVTSVIHFSFVFLIVKPKRGEILSFIFIWILSSNFVKQHLVFFFFLSSQSGFIFDFFKGVAQQNSLSLSKETPTGFQSCSAMTWGV